MSRGSLSATMDERRRHRLNERMQGKHHDEFGRKTWMQCDKSSSAWVPACPKEHNSLNKGQFHVVCQTYFGVPRAWRDCTDILSCRNQAGEGSGAEGRNVMCTDRIWSRPPYQEEGGHIITTASTYNFTRSSCSRACTTIWRWRTTSSKNSRRWQSTHSKLCLS